MIEIGERTFSSEEEFINFIKSRTKSLDSNDIRKIISLYEKTKDITELPKTKKDSDNKLILAEGTLIHGVRTRGILNTEDLNKISQDGLLGTAFFRDQIWTSAPASVCCWCIPKEITLEEYYKNYNTPEKYQTSYTMKKTDEETNELVNLKRETSYLPSEPKYGKINADIAFIIPPIPNEETILSNSEKLQLHSFANSATVPIGIPSNIIAGIFVSKRLLNDREELNQLISIFPDKYIATPNGDIIYEPIKKESLEESNDKNKIDLREKETRISKGADSVDELRMQMEIFWRYSTYKTPGDLLDEFEATFKNECKALNINWLKEFSSSSRIYSFRKKCQNYVNLSAEDQQREFPTIEAKSRQLGLDFADEFQLAQERNAIIKEIEKDEASSIFSNIMLEEECKKVGLSYFHENLRATKKSLNKPTGVVPIFSEIEPTTSTYSSPPKGYKS